MPPSLLLSLVFALLYGSTWHVLFGRRAWQLPVYLVAAVAGFFAGFIAGVVLGIEWLRVGSIPLLASTLGASLALWGAWYLVLPASATQSNDAESDD